MMISLSGIQK